MSTTRRILGPLQPLDAALISLTSGSLAVSVSLAVSYPSPSDEVRWLLRVTTVAFVFGFVSIDLLVIWSRARSFIRARLRSHRRKAAREHKTGDPQSRDGSPPPSRADSLSTIKGKPPVVAASRRHNGRPATVATRPKELDLTAEAPEAP